MRKKLLHSFILTGVLCIGTLIPALLTAQQKPTDSLRLTLPEAEKTFLQNNLTLIAAKYNIDANKALIQQTKLWDNPVLMTDQNVYDGRFFRHTANAGQVYIQVQQLIRTAGKRTKLAQLATDNTTLAQEQFDDVMRSLQYSLRNDFVETDRLLKIKMVYDDEIADVEQLVKGMDEVYKVGNISLKENLRLKALLFGLKNELVNVNTQLLPLQGEIKLLLQSNDTAFVLPVLTAKDNDLVNVQLPLVDSLVSIANENRPDAKIAKTQLGYEQHNLVYQKALAKPDVTVGPEFDRLNSYQPNYVGLSVSLPLNIFNRNQGNIKSAQYNMQQQQAQLSYQSDKIRNEVSTALTEVKYFQGINNDDQTQFSTSYEKLFDNMLKSYRQRQINLLDFTDFLDSYKDTRLKLIEQRAGLAKAFAALNYTVNQNIIQL